MRAWLFALLGLAPVALPRSLRSGRLALWGRLGDRLRGRGGPIEARWSPPAAFAIALLTLLLLEQLYRNSRREAQRGTQVSRDRRRRPVHVRPVPVRAGRAARRPRRGELACARLRQRVLVPLLALGARRLPNTDLRVFVSRQVTFYTTTFLAAGVYLLVMSAAGYAIRAVRRRLGRNRARRLPGRRIRGADHPRDLGGDAPAPARIRQQALLSQQVRLPHRMAAVHQDAVRQRCEPMCHAPCVQAVAQTLESPGGLLFIVDEYAAGDSCRPPAGRSRSATFRIVTPLAADDPTGRSSCSERRWIVDLREHARERRRLRRRRGASVARRDRAGASCRRSSGSMR